MNTIPGKVGDLADLPPYLRDDWGGSSPPHLDPAPGAFGRRPSPQYRPSRSATSAGGRMDSSRMRRSPLTGSRTAPDSKSPRL